MSHKQYILSTKEGEILEAFFFYRGINISHAKNFRGWHKSQVRTYAQECGLLFLNTNTWAQLFITDDMIGQ